MADTIRETFAKNLRMHCGNFPSIAHVCRGVTINRQQFNKYLQGQNLPSSRLRRKLCQFLGVSEEEMFAKASVMVKPENGTTSPYESQVHPKSGNEFAKRLAASISDDENKSGILTLRPGFYLCYFHLQNFSHFLVRSLLKVTASNQGVTFVRHTYFRSSTYPPRVISRGRHSGVVFESAQEISLLGFSACRPHHFSLLTFEKMKDEGEDILLGIGLTKGSSKTFATRVCLEFIGSKRSDAKAKLEFVGVVGLNDPTINENIAIAMSQDIQQSSGQLNVMDLERVLATSAIERIKADSAETSTFSLGIS